jgi:hypothetical protein
MKTVLTVLAACGGYATLRYNVFKAVAWSEWPVYVFNKVCALSALVLLMIYALRRRRGPAVGGTDLLVPAWLLMLTHVGLSLAILAPAYYAKYFQADKLTWQAGWSMLLGVVAAVAFHKCTRACELMQATGLLKNVGGIAFVSGLHAALLGYAGWFDPGAWPGRMVPITLLSFAAGSVALWAALRPGQNAAPAPAVPPV